MRIEQVKKLNPVARLLYWVQEREQIRLKKEAGEPRPWTDDRILHEFRFCNVRRMDDRVSKWILNNWLKPHFGHKNMLLACAVARHFNLPSTLQEIGFPEVWRPESVKTICEDLQREGHKVFNGAYIISGFGSKEGKIKSVVDKVLTPLYEDPPPIDANNMQKSVEALCTRFGFSGFMAGQTIADLRWGWPGSWADKDVWAPMGPGSKRGMNRLHGRDIDAPLNKLQWERELRELIERLHKELPSIIMKGVDGISAQSLCCEYDKYIRALLGEGKPKQFYRPQGA